MFERLIVRRGIGAACWVAGVLLWAGAASAQMFPNTPLGAAAGLGGGMGLPGNGGMMIPGNGMVLRGSDPGAVDVCAVMPNSDACRQKTASSAPEQNKRILPPEPPSEFQRFISASAQEILPMYGYSLFNEPPDTFAPVDNIPVTPDYMIGPGDELVIKGWGQVDIDVRAVVNRNGEINLPQVGTINVAGVHYEDLQPYLKNAVGRVFRNFDLSVTLGTLRSIQVFVVGQARSPGTYTVSSLSTLVNALFVSGGPSKKGSMRHIQVKRNGKVVTEFDLYDLLLNGDKTKDVSLQPGDVIYIPPVGNLVAISGSVNNPAIYELKDGEATLASLIEMGGGLTTTAFGQKARIERIENRGGRAVAEFSLDQSGMARAIKDGDYVYVMPIDARFDNAVTLRGSVAHPGRYPWREGMRVRDLIPNMDALITSRYWEAQNEADERGSWISSERKYPNESGRKDSRNQNSMAQDGRSSMQRKGEFSTEQAKRFRTERDEQNNVRPEAGYSASEINLDYAVIERLDKSDLTTTLIPFNLGKALKGDDRQNLPLQPGDTIRVFARSDIEIPVANRSVYVRLAGEVNNAGIYRALPGETLRQIVARVGGVTPDAYLFAAELNRESVRQLQQQRLREMADRMEDEVTRNQANRVRSALDQESAGMAQAQAQTGMAIVSRFRQVQARGRVVLEMSPDSSLAKDLPDIVLEDGDVFTVPAKPSVVNVMGMVYSQNSYMYRPDKTVSEYIEQAGGATRDADTSHNYVLRADGSVVSAQNSSAFWGDRFSGGTLMPGDTIVVPEMLDKYALTRELKDWSQILYQFALGAAGIAILF